MKLMKYWRLGYVTIVLFCLASVSFALYMQHYEFVIPCPLCIFQRVGLMACGLLALIAGLFPLRNKFWVWPTVIAFAAACGAAVSIRHIQIQQSLATSQPQTCGAGLDFMLQTQSFHKVVTSVLAGHGDCTIIDWQFGFLTLPMMALAGFVLILSGAMGIAYCQKNTLSK